MSCLRKTCLIFSRRFVFVKLKNVTFKSGSVFHSNAIIFMWAKVTAARAPTSQKNWVPLRNGRKGGYIFLLVSFPFPWLKKIGWGRGGGGGVEFGHLLGLYRCGTHSNLKQVQLGALGSLFSASQQGYYCSSHAILTQASALWDSEARSENLILV